MSEVLAQIGPILTGLALVITALGGLRLARAGRERELADRVAKAESAQRDAEAQCYRRTSLLREIEQWLISKGLLEGRTFDSGEHVEFPERLRSELDKETGS